MEKCGPLSLCVSDLNRISLCKSPGEIALCSDNPFRYEFSALVISYTPNNKIVFFSSTTAPRACRRVTYYLACLDRVTR